MMRAGALILWLCAVTAVACNASAATAAQTPAAGAAIKMAPTADGQAESAIRAVEDDERQAMLRGDAAALERFWAAELLVNAPGGKIRTRPEVLEYVKSGRLKYSAFERHIERIAVHGDVAVAMGAETVVPATGPDAGKTLHRRYSDVFTRQNGQWRLIARQTTIVP